MYKYGVTDRLVEIAARSDAFFDGRDFDGLSRVEKHRYLERSRATLGVVFEAMYPRKVKHKKRGTSYVVIGNGIAQCTVPIKDMEPVTVYRDIHDGRLCVRPPHEFEDGRFTEISTGD